MSTIIKTAEAGIFALHLESDNSVDLIINIEYNGKVIQINNGNYRTIRYLWLAEPTRVIVKGRSACNLHTCSLTLVAALDGLQPHTENLLPMSPTDIFQGVALTNNSFIATMKANSAVTLSVPKDCFMLINADKHVDAAYGGVIYRACQGHVICPIGASSVTITSLGTSNTISASIFTHGTVSC